MQRTFHSPWPVACEKGGSLTGPLVWRTLGHGPRKVLLLHALTGDLFPEGEGGWWAPLFEPGAPLDPRAATVFVPNLPGSCYGSTGPKDTPLFPSITVRDQAQFLARWMESQELHFDLCLGGSLGGMVALELGILCPGRFAHTAVLAAGGRTDPWAWGLHHAQRAILETPFLIDAEAMALARHVAMVSFRSAPGLQDRFGTDSEGLRRWLEHHGKRLAARFHRDSYRVLLGAMDAHDIGRGRGGAQAALRNWCGGLSLFAIRSDALFAPALMEELHDDAHAAGVPCRLTWSCSPHGHDAFLIETEEVKEWLKSLLVRHVPSVHLSVRRPRLERSSFVSCEAPHLEL